MASPSSDPINAGGVCNWFKAVHEKLRSKVSEVAKEAKKLGEDDPRRIIHSIKVGIAICLVSLVYYFDPLYEGFGISAMWAVMTVVVIFEFSVGATLGRGFNRSVATLIAGGLGVGAHRYDYGLLIFILTFCLICVSGYRDDEVLDMANIRLSTVLIGGATAVIICLCICPVWAGDDLHNLVALNMEKLANSLQGFGAEYFRTQEDEECSKEEDPKLLMQGYKDVLNSKSAEESLANSAKWEPRHGRFRYRHPWNQYLKIGALTRQCACRMEALHGYLNSEIQASPEVRAKIEEPCTKMSTECSYALNELSLAIKTMTWPSSANSHIANSKTAAENLKSSLKTEPWPSTADLLEIIPVAAVASLLIDVVTCTEKIAESVLELASITNMKKLEQPDQRPMQPKRLNHVISIDVPAQGPAE
ncbi:Aluminum-activated malate transporter like [Actinidia chinensis var. chinensis]|uniref:Aluminum-activated malate transporter like n=1 Tax=Actinidia chinensis var. chinensis TaxID=1590841 RepID=A0A2R6P7K3_ACTCC|nr:Aluminum-activated malate transporter like [Actinidia chinensis var. chinensis]